MNLHRLLALTGLSLAASLHAGQISTASYSNDFTSSAADFATTKPAAGTGWILDTAAPGYFGHNDLASVSGTYTASVEHTLLGGAAADAMDFTFDASVVYTANGVSSFNTLGVGFLNSASTLANANGYALYIRGVATGTPAASVFLTRNGVIVASAGSTSSEMRDFIGDTFSYHIAGSYVDAVGGDGINDSLSLAVTFTNVTDNISFSLGYVDNAPLVGKHFGMNAGDAGTTTLGAQWDTFALATIPEPSTYAVFVGVLGLGLALIRRRR